jgi:hypothetical protein
VEAFLWSMQNRFFMLLDEKGLAVGMGWSVYQG